MSDDHKDDNELPEKYRQTNPEIAHWGVAPGEGVRVRDKRNRRKILGSNGDRALGVDCDPFSGE
jgi:hypothetical protein